MKYDEGARILELLLILKYCTDSIISCWVYGEWVPGEICH